MGNKTATKWVNENNGLVWPKKRPNNHTILRARHYIEVQLDMYEQHFSMGMDRDQYDDVLHTHVVFSTGFLKILLRKLSSNEFGLCICNDTVRSISLPRVLLPTQQDSTPDRLLKCDQDSSVDKVVGF